MDPRIARQLMRSPRQMIQYQTTGRLPRQTRLDSPLIRLLERYTPHQRLRIRGVRLSPSLGYRCGHQFHNAEQLLRWLQPHETHIEGEPAPASESFRDKRFNAELSEADLKAHTACWELP